MSEVSAVVQRNAQNTIDAVEAFGTSVTSHAMSSNSTFPFVTIPNYPSRASRVAKLANAKYVIYAPLVQQEDRTRYEEYVNEHKQATYQEGIEFEELNKTVEEVMDQSQPYIFSLNLTTDEWSYQVTRDEGTGDDPFLPVWQSYTMFMTDFLYTNFNLISLNRIRNTFWTTYSTKIPFLDVVTLPNIQNPQEYKIESQIMQPIFDSIYNKDHLHPNEKPPKIVGVVWLALDWITYFQVRFVLTSTSLLEAHGAFALASGFSSHFALFQTLLFQHIEFTT